MSGPATASQHFLRCCFSEFFEAFFDTTSIESLTLILRLACETRFKGNHHHHLSLNREGRWGTTDNFATSFLHLSLFSTALCDLANSRPVHSLMLSSRFILCLPCLRPPFTVPCNMVLARPYEREIWPQHCSFQRQGRGQKQEWKTSFSFFPLQFWMWLGCFSFFLFSFSLSFFFLKHIPLNFLKTYFSQ